MSNNNYILTFDGNFISDEELYHYGTPGMKWGHRKKMIISKNGVNSRQKKNIVSNSINSNIGKRTYSTNTTGIKSGSNHSKSINAAHKNVKQTTKSGKKTATKTLSKMSGKTLSSINKAAKTGMGVAQAMWNISDAGMNARQTASYVNAYTSMSPDYMRRFMYD